MNATTIFALILFIITYVIMFAFQRIRPLAAITSALIFVIVGSLGIFGDFQYSVLEALPE